VRSLSLIADHAAAVWIQLAPHLSDSQLAATEQLSMALVDSVPLHPPSPLLTAARQQQRCGAKMIKNGWQALGVGLSDTQEIARIVASNTASIDLPIWLRSEPSCRFYAGSHYHTSYTISSYLFTNLVLNICGRTYMYIEQRVKTLI